MKIINRIKKLFKRNSITMTNSKDIVLYGISLSEIPEFDSLDDNDKEKVINYMNELDVNNMEKIIGYNDTIPKESVVLSGLLTEYLNKINEVIRLDDKDEYEIEKMQIDLIIKNMQVSIIKKILDDYFYESKLITRAALMYKEEFLKKEHRFITYFSKPALYKRNTQIHSLDNLIQSCILTVTVLDQHVQAALRAINCNYNLIDRVNVLNKLMNQTELNQFRVDVYKQKYYLFLRIRSTLNCNFSKLNELERLVSEPLDEDKEKEIINILSLLEIELDKYVKNNETELINLFRTQFNDDKFRKMMNMNVSKEEIISFFNPLEDILDTFEQFHIISLLIPNKVTENEKAFIGTVLFGIMTNDIIKDNNFYDIFINNPYCSLRDDDLVNTFIEIIENKIYKINNGLSEVSKRFKSENQIKGLLNALDTYFKDKDGKYDYKGILFDKDKLTLLVAFNSLDHFNNLFNKIMISKESINLQDSKYLEWDDYLPLKSVCYLYEIVGIIPFTKPLYYDIYNACKEKDGRINSFILRPFEYNNYILPEGIKKIHFDSDEYEYPKRRDDLLWKEYVGDLMEGVISAEPVNTQRRSMPEPHDLYSIVIDAIRNDSNNKELVLPSSLISISGNVFGDSKIKKIHGGARLYSIGDNAFINQRTGFVDICPSLDSLSPEAFDYEKIKLKFYYYEDSKFLYNLLFSNAKEDLDFVKMMAYLVDERKLDDMISHIDGDPTVCPSLTIDFTVNKSPSRKYNRSDVNFDDIYINEFRKKLGHAICKEIGMTLVDFFLLPIKPEKMTQSYLNSKKQKMALLLEKRK